MIFKAFLLLNAQIYNLLFTISVQLMDRGVFGVCGVPAVNHVAAGNSPALENVTTLHRGATEGNVLEAILTHRHATLLPVQVMRLKVFCDVPLIKHFGLKLC